MTAIVFTPVRERKKVTHAFSGRGAKIIRRTKDDTWYLKRGKTKMALTVHEAACIASDGYVILGLEGGNEFDRIVREMWNRVSAKTTEISARKLSGKSHTGKKKSAPKLTHTK